MEIKNNNDIKKDLFKNYSKKNKKKGNYNIIKFCSIGFKKLKY